MEFSTLKIKTHNFKKHSSHPKKKYVHTIPYSHVIHVIAYQEICLSLQIAPFKSNTLSILKLHSEILVKGVQPFTIYASTPGSSFRSKRDVLRSRVLIVSLGIPMDFSISYLAEYTNKFENVN